MTNKEILELLIKGNEKDALRAISAVEKKAKDADGNIKKSSTATTKAISGFWGYMGAKIGNIVTRLLGSVVKFGADSYKKFQELEYAMAKVSAVTGGTETQIGRLDKKVKELGATTQFTAGQIADAAYNLGLAGLDTSQIEEALPALSNFSIATGTDLAKGADIATTSMNALGMEFTETGRFTDVMTKASTTSATTVAQMAEAFKKAAPTAGSLGIQVEELGTYLGLMADGGIRGSSAGTAMMNVLNRMDGSIPAAKKALDMLGVSAYDSEGNFRGLETVMVEMREGWGKLTQEEQVYVSKNLATQRGQAGFAQIMNTSVDRLSEMKRELRDAGGATEEMAEKMADTSKGINDRFVSAIDGLKVALGERLAPTFDSIKESFTGWIDVLLNGSDDIGTFISDNEFFAQKEYEVWLGAKEEVIKLREDYYGELKDGVKDPQGLPLLIAAEEEMLKKSLDVHQAHLVEVVNRYSKVYPKLKGLLPDLQTPEEQKADAVAEYKKNEKALKNNTEELIKHYNALDTAVPFGKAWFALQRKIASLEETKVKLGLEPLRKEAELLGESLDYAVNNEQREAAVKAITEKLAFMGTESKKSTGDIKKELLDVRKVINDSAYDEETKKSLLTAINAEYADRLLEVNAAHMEQAKVVHDALGSAGKDYDAYGNKMGEISGTMAKFFKGDMGAFYSTSKEVARVLADITEIPLDAAFYVDGEKLSTLQTLQLALLGNEDAIKRLESAGYIGRDALIEFAEKAGLGADALKGLDDGAEGAEYAIEDLVEVEKEKLAPELDNTKEKADNAKEGLEGVGDGADTGKDRINVFTGYLNQHLFPTLLTAQERLLGVKSDIEKLPKKTNIDINFNISQKRTFTEIYNRVISKNNYGQPEWSPYNPYNVIKNAAGGIFNGKTQLGNHLFGEAGKEAIVPLTNSRTMQPFAKAIADNMERGNSGGDLNITIKEMNVRNDNDIKKIAKELESLRQRKTTQRR